MTDSMASFSRVQPFDEGRTLLLAKEKDPAGTKLAEAQAENLVLDSRNCERSCAVQRRPPQRNIRGSTADVDSPSRSTRAQTRAFDANAGVVCAELVRERRLTGRSLLTKAV